MAWITFAELEKFDEEFSKQYERLCEMPCYEEQDEIDKGLQLYNKSFQDYKTLLIDYEEFKKVFLISDRELAAFGFAFDELY